MADVVCTVSKVEGQFPTLLSIDGCRTRGGEDALLLVERLSGALEAACLTGTDDVNPYAMWHIKAGPGRRRVFLVADAADAGRYEIERSE
ncbi:MAG: hypothetical protein ABMA64_26230 [Myxococcota bacterium]